MASHDGQTKTNTENIGAESVKELEQNQSPGVVDTAEDGEPVCKKQKLADVTQDELTEFRVVLVGKIGMGKSALGNSILRKQVFNSSYSCVAVTEEATSNTCELTMFDKKITLQVCDTPGMFDASLPTLEIMNIILKCMTHSHPGPHVFLFVMKLDRISQEYMETIKHFKANFDDDVLRFTRIIFTGRDLIKEPLENFLKPALEKMPEFNTFIQQCDKYESINNNGSEDEINQDVNRILHLISLTITKNSKNNCGFYTNKMCEEAKQFYKKKQEEDEKKKKAKLRREIELEIRTKIQEEERTKIKEEERGKLLGQLPPELKRQVKSALQPSTSEDTDHQQESKPASSQGSSSAETGVVRPMSTRDYQAKPIPSSTGTKPRKSQVTTKTAGTRGRVRGPMKEPDRTNLNKNIPELLKIITEPERILQSLCARDVFDGEDREKVKKEKREHGNRAGVTELLNRLLDCGSDALQLFKPCLTECGYKQALELPGFNNEAEGTKEKTGHKTFPSKETDERMGIFEKTFKDSKYPLHEAASIVDNIHDFTDILDRNRDQINSLNSKGETVFTCAMLSASIPADKLKLLLDQEADRKLIKEKITRENILQICKSSPTPVLKFLIDTKLITISNFIQEVLFQVCKSDKDPVGKLKVLLSNGCDVHVKDYYNRGLLHTACQSGSLETVKYLINQGLGCNDKDRYDQTPLYYCCKSDIDPFGKLKVLVSNEGDLHVKDDNNKGLLHFACWLGSLETVKYLINQGLACNDRDTFGQTPLYYCCLSDKDSVGKLEVLSSNGGDLHVRDNNKRGLLHTACESGSQETVKYLINQGLSCNDKARFGRTPLYYCCLSDKDSVGKLEVLLSNGGDVHVKDDDNIGLLHTACESGSLETVKYLINQGLGCNDKDSDSQTPLYYCCISDIDPVGKLEVLLSNGGDVHVKDGRFTGLLHTACKSSSLETVKYLINQGLGCNDKCGDGHTPLYYCCASDIDIVGKVEVLSSNGGDLYVN